MSLLDFDDDYFLEEDKMYVTHVEYRSIAP